ncbi:Predicted DNA-binding transcriptional regulator YafY, contains an HTH and WYL domains [Pseudobutyrivibrio sp. AR14]|uniref:helix-turn-helix transcriptional regulator n=1 Tax=Pseudobutyrivibrio sp. AR14 TaxID=1520804 RepID=UPI000887E4A1|nr:WYL domain-containing protein [Pseudobutyrivibrio sp. AR14]SCY21528.1 Predicted DNA-binding transcriptional regulator YafY, contains an HTH and WYL domains [Pseudobutyrivibrio sp. AR14]
MYGTGTKKMLNMLILDILRDYSDSEHRLLQQDIIDLLKNNYGMNCERRAVKNNIVSLQEMGYDIVAKQGYYLNTRDFTDAELRLMIDSIFTSGAISDKDAHSLVKKLERYSNKYFKAHVSHIHSTSSGKNTDNPMVMDSIAIIDEAISKGRQISFSYLQYGIDFKLHPKRSQKYIVSPYQMISNRGKYYLIANTEEYENLSHFRLDRITNVEILKDKNKPIKSIHGYERGLNLKDYLAEHFYMFHGESIHIKLKAHESLMDNLVDSFGKEFRVEPAGDDEIVVSLKCNPDTFFYWAMQYGLNIEVLEPESMRERIQSACREIEKKYC